MDLSWLTHAIGLASQVTPLHLSITAGFLQVLGYVLYIRKSIRNEVEPNPATWLMFAYGTALLTVLEWDAGAEWNLLVLPVICAILSIYVAYLCWKKGRLGWPDHLADQTAFIADLMLTAGYIGAWALSIQGDISTGTRELATLWFLVLSNATTVTAFLPLLRDAYLNPDREHSPSWAVWTLAYTTLGIGTYMNISGAYTFAHVSFKNTPSIPIELWILMLYPVSNAILHALVSWFARATRHGGKKITLKTAPS